VFVGQVVVYDLVLFIYTSLSVLVGDLCRYFHNSCNFKFVFTVTFHG
jgi:hypothetical protein